jgi:hypothetical protein
MSLMEKIEMFVLKRELKKERWKPMMTKIASLWKFLEGKKTYFMVAGAVGTEIAAALGYISPDQRTTLIQIFGMGAAATLAAKTNRAMAILKAVLPPAEPPKA